VQVGPDLQAPAAPFMHGPHTAPAGNVYWYDIQQQRNDAYRPLLRDDADARQQPLDGATRTLVELHESPVGHCILSSSQCSVHDLWRRKMCMAD
jgi:hypothetical protein